MLRLEELTEEEMDKFKKTFTQLAKSDPPLSDDEDEQVEEEHAAAQNPARRP